MYSTFMKGGGGRKSSSQAPVHLVGFATVNNTDGLNNSVNETILNTKGGSLNAICIDNCSYNYIGKRKNLRNHYRYHILM